MDWLSITAILLTLAAVMSYLNRRFFKLPGTIALTAMSLLLAVAGILAGMAGFDADSLIRRAVGQIDFADLLLNGMLGLLLFAAALHVNFQDLVDNKWPIGIFATVGTIGSTVLVGSMTWLLSQLLSLPIDPIHCFLFGALISPTDPIAILAIIRRVGAPKSLEVKVTGESLFNDGIGVVVFLSVLSIATGQSEASFGQVATLFAREAAGGIILGVAAGWLAYRLLKTIDDYKVEVLITLALVMGTYSLGLKLHVSAPLAVVAAGLLIGNEGRRLAMSESTRRNLTLFWQLIDEVLNAVLFVLIGLEVLVLSLRGQFILAGCIAIPLVLLARLVSIGVPVKLLRLTQPMSPGAASILTWGGLRGGISVALALSLPQDDNWQSIRDLLVTMTYVVVVFSILVQGLTIGPLIKRYTGQTPLLTERT